MSIFRVLALALLALTTSACAGRSVRPDPPASPSTTSQVFVPGPEGERADLTTAPIERVESSIGRPDGTAGAETDDKPEIHPLPASNDRAAGALSEAPVATPPGDTAISDPEADVALIYGSQEVRDPWEDYNRRIHRFNNATDRYFARPLAIAYDRVMPEPVQTSIGKFFGNLREPGTMVNQVLQGRPVRAVQTLGRFLVNTTVGVGGLFDPASRFGMPSYNEDLGQTFAMWGWHDSRYLVLPLLGPRTARDSVSMLGEQPLSPLGYVKSGMAANGLRILQMADGRSRLLPMDDIRKQSVDEYVLVRDAWLQRRRRQIDQDRHQPNN